MQGINILLEDAHFENESGWRSYFYDSYKGMLIISVIGVLAGTILWSQHLMPILGMVIGVFCGTLLAAIYLFWYVNPLRYLKRYKGFFKEVTIKVTDESISSKVSDISEQILYWKAFKKYYENPKYYILFTLANRFLIIPKSRISDDESQWLKKILVTKNLRRTY